MTRPYTARQPRVPFERRVWVGNADVNGPMKRLWAQNLSKGGMFIRTREPFQLGSQLLVALDGAQEILPLAEGTVVWQRQARDSGESPDQPPGVGIAFTSLKPAVGVLLDTLVESGGVPAPVYPAHNSVLRPEPKTPVLRSADSPILAAEPAWVMVTLPGIGPVRIRANPEGGVELEFDDQSVNEVESSSNTVSVKFR